MCPKVKRIHLSYYWHFILHRITMTYWRLESQASLIIRIITAVRAFRCINAALLVWIFVMSHSLGKRCFITFRNANMSFPVQMIKAIFFWACAAAVVAVSTCSLPSKASNYTHICCLGNSLLSLKPVKTATCHKLSTFCPCMKIQTYIERGGGTCIIRVQ